MILCNYLQGCNNFLPCIWAEVGASGGTIRPPSLIKICALALILPHPNTYLAALDPPYAAMIRQYNSLPSPLGLHLSLLPIGGGGAASALVE